MAGTVEEIMTRDPRTVEIGDSLVDAAREMRDGDIGSVIVTDGGRVAGIVTDRDIVVRAIAEGRDPQSTTVGDVCSSGPRTLEPGDSVEVAAQVMGESSIRRLPVVRDGRLVGVVSLGDLAQDRDAGQPLANISAASPNH
jgi:CBS domain-containing protein